MKGVFDAKSNSGYDDNIVEKYHFPDRADYLENARRLIGDWVVYREPRRNSGQQAYVAVAHVDRIEPDPDRYGYHFARVSSFLPFDRAVPLSEDGRYAEQFLRELSDTTRVGASLRGNSIRLLTDADFNALVRSGLANTLAPENARRLELDPAHVDAAALELLSAPPAVQERQIEQILVNRTIRDGRFRGLICQAYNNKCAVTRLHMVNGGGNPEVQAAHIIPVNEGGPDVVQNGIALSATVHWLFDRHLIALTDDYRLLVSHNKVPRELQSLFVHQMEQIHLPGDPAFRPYLPFVAKHREKFSAS